MALANSCKHLTKQKLGTTLKQVGQLKYQAKKNKTKKNLAEAPQKSYTQLNARRGSLGQARSLLLRIPTGTRNLLCHPALAETFFAESHMSPVHK